MSLFLLVNHFFFLPAFEVIAEYRARDVSEIRVNEDAILEMLRRRPCTAGQITEVFGMHLNEVAKFIGILLRSEKISAIHRGPDVYYFSEN